MIRRRDRQRTLWDAVLFGAPDPTATTDPVLRRVDEALEDDALIDGVLDWMRERFPKSSTRGRRGTPAEPSLGQRFPMRRRWFASDSCSMATRPRLHGEVDHRIDDRHVVWSLVRKPGAFARYKYREDLFPSLTVRHAYDALRGWRGDRGDIEYVRILHLAASTMQSLVDAALTSLLEAGTPFEYTDVQKLAAPRASEVPEMRIAAPDLHAYDALLAGGAR